ncbi:unnamed protein product [Nesidiocoris tenuis]|uniref:ADP-ribosylation factor-like protein 16 n=2 Tax=Nesidiocoris tenuis TaxID=355587 RepID=A0A6H5HB64_9HEMI|nr:ADP-ribosylation factor family [Nesidiocoris tenuis]CAB0013644.1 unnamed protein product [Nesidiocoris tenuis]CAB0013645.1 unnamed protein product [Nesidiocoris tenuis]
MYLNFLSSADVLCVGPPGSGKTLLLKTLTDQTAVDNTTTSGPTTGMSLKKIVPCQGAKPIIICELGGGMAPLWHHYYEGMQKIMFVVDASNLCQISAAGVLLYSLLAEPCLQSAKVLLVLSKMDASYRQMRNEALLMLQMKKLQEQARQEITIIQASSDSNEGIDEIMDWLVGPKKKVEKGK